MQTSPGDILNNRVDNILQILSNMNTTYSTQLVTIKSALNTLLTSGASMSINNLNITNTTVQSIITANNNIVISQVDCMVDVTTSPITYLIQNASYNETTNILSVTWHTLLGVTVTPANLGSLASVSTIQSIDDTFIVYNATAAGAGYNQGDVLVHAYGLTAANTPVLSYSYWYNASSGIILSAEPSASTYSLSYLYNAPTNTGSSSGGSLASSVSQSGVWDVVVTSLPSLPAGNAVLGSVQPATLTTTETVFSIAAAATNYVALPANTNRKLLAIKIYNSAQGTVWISFGSAAYTGTIYRGMDFVAGGGIILDTAVTNAAINIASDLPCTVVLLEG